MGHQHDPDRDVPLTSSRYEGPWTEQQRVAKRPPRTEKDYESFRQERLSHFTLSSEELMERFDTVADHRDNPEDDFINGGL